MIEAVGRLARFSHVAGMVAVWLVQCNMMTSIGLLMLELRGFCFDARICFPYQENLRHMPNVYIYIYNGIHARTKNNLLHVATVSLRFASS